jgi:hypothetical protein
MIYLENVDNIQLSEIDLPDIMAGNLTQQELKVVNTYTVAKNVLIKAVASDINQQGNSGSTYNAALFGTDGTNFSDTITVAVAASSTTTFYIRYAPASTTLPSEKEFALEYYEVES